VSIWLGFSLFDLYHVAEVITLFLYRHSKLRTKISGLDTISEEMSAFKPYNLYTSQNRRDLWKRKARVSAIIQRMNHSHYQRANILGSQF